MSFSYVVPSILYLAPGTTCHLPVPWDQIGTQLVGGRGRVLWYAHAYCDGARVGQDERIVEFLDGVVVGGLPASCVWHCNTPPLDERPGFLECGVRSGFGDPIFASKRPLSFYTVYAAAGRKSYFSDNAWKYASPPVIAQIAEYGKFVDTYSVVRVDRDRDMGMSLILINPYLKAVLSRVQTQDGRKLERIRVAPQSAQQVPLDGLLQPDERVWTGQIQLTANNRLVTYITWHSLADPTVIGDQEHLDPYRGETTHLPATQLLRLGAGMKLRDLRTRDPL